MKFDSSEELSELPPDALFVPASASPDDLTAGPAEAASGDDSAVTAKPRRRRRGGRGRGGRGRGKAVRRKAPAPTAETVVPAEPDALAALPSVYQSTDADPILSEASGSREAEPPSPPVAPHPAELPLEITAPQDQHTGLPAPSVSTPGSAGSAGYAVQRPNPDRLVARAAPGLTRHSGRRSFSQGKVRHQFRPTGTSRSITSSGITDSLIADLVPPAPVHRHQTRRQADPAGKPAHAENVRMAPPSPMQETIPVRLPDSDSGTPADSAAQEPDLMDGEVPSSKPVARKKGPPQIMLVNVADSEEVRIAIVCQGVLEELYTERASHDLHVGNIYKGRVTNVEPSIQAAFVDFGIGKNGFLHISDLHPQYFPQHHKSTAKMHAAGAKKADTSELSEGPQSTEPDSAANFEEMGGEIDELFDEDAEILVDNDHIAPMERVGRKTPRHSRPPIQQCLRRGQEIIVQVTKEGIGTKGPTLTSYISVPGRYLVMMPGMSALGVSHRPPGAVYGVIGHR